MKTYLLSPFVYLIFITLLVFLSACEEENPEKDPDIVPDEKTEPDLIRFDHSSKLIYDGGGMSIPNVVDLGDFDNDKDLDVVLHDDTYGEIKWIENDGEGNFSTTVTLPNSYSNISDLASFDFNKDGYADVVALVKTNDNEFSAFIWENTGNGIFKDRVLIKVISGQANNIVVIDHNKDEKPDIAIGIKYGPPLVLVNNNSGAWSSNALSEAIGYSSYLAFGDMDSNGTTDIVATGGSSLYVNEKKIDYFNGSSSFVNVKDMDNDGDLDIITQKGYENGVAWLEYENGIAHENIFIPPSNSEWLRAVEIADFDEDGDNDVILGYWTSSSPGFYINSGDKEFTTQDLRITGVSNDNCMVSGDINGDGKIDIVVSNAGSHTVRWYQN